MADSEHGAPWWQQAIIIAAMIVFFVITTATATPRTPQHLCHGGNTPGHTYICDNAGHHN